MIGQVLAIPDNGWRRYDNSDTRIIYNGTGWGVYSDGSNYGGTDTRSRVTTTNITFKFKGTKIRLIDIENYDWSNSIVVTIDGVDYNTSLYRASAQYKTIYFEKLDLVDGIHTVVIKSNEANYWGIDCIDIDNTGDMLGTGVSLTAPDVGWRRYDDTDARFNYSGTWTTGSNAARYNGGNQFTYLKSAYVSFKFYGSKLRIISNKYTDRAPYNILSIDGVLYNVETYNSTPMEGQYVVFEKIDLSNGIHEVKYYASDSFIDGTNVIAWDAIDIDDIGDLVGSGIKLAAPESGWRRYDDSDSRIRYVGTWLTFNDIYRYGPGMHYTTTVGSYVEFKFYGTKLRFLSSFDNTEPNSNCINIAIDGTLIGTSNPYNAANPGISPGVMFDIQGLPLQIHTVRVECTVTTGFKIGVDAIDIDSTGYLIHPILNQINSINTAQTGVCIPCRYTTLASGQVGFFSELGICTADEIPLAGTAIPDGLFYFIKTDKGFWIADRVIQTGINWDTLNAAKFIEGISTQIEANAQLSSNINKGYIASASTNGTAGYEPYVAFDKRVDTGSSTCYCWGINTNAPSWLALEFPSPVAVNKYSFTGQYQFPNRTPQNWTFEGWDGTKWNVLDTQTNVTDWTNLVYKTFAFSNNTAYKKYRININANNGDTGVTAIGEMKLYLCNNITIRSLSGGVAYIDSNGNKSSADKSLGGWPSNNEWDKYIVASDLKGKIIAGDNNIWHWDIANGAGRQTWLKDTPYNANSNRNLRPYLTGDLKTMNLAYGSGNIITNLGFRPVLIYIESDIANEVIY